MVITKTVNEVLQAHIDTLITEYHRYEKLMDEEDYPYTKELALIKEQITTFSESMQFNEEY